MGILIDSVRILNYRAIKNLEVNLSKLTLLVGANNAGKTSFLKALNLALGIDRKTVNREDVHEDGTLDVYKKEIIIDIRIIAVDDTGIRIQDFDENWAESDRISGNIKTDAADYQFLGIRTKYKFDNLSQTFKQESYTLKQWLPFENWTLETNEDKKFQKPDTIPLIFVDAQRDIQADLKDRSSFLGKMTNKPDIKQDDIEPIEKQINTLNESIISKSSNLKTLKEKLKELNKTVLSATDEGVEIAPINKKISDIGRNLNINFNDSGTQSFPLEYHGMGTRSWASLLTLNAFISWQEEINNPYFPILALEEPEAHLHPNAQRQLYHQLKEITGQKIISTHSPFVAAQCDLMDLRHFYKDSDGLKVGQLEFSEPYEKRIAELQDQLKDPLTDSKIKQAINEEKQQLLIEKRGKINNEEKRKIERNIFNTRGEALFSKALVFFEGETEEQALPILFKEKFGCYPFEIGINFIGVGGKDNYKPFIIFAKFLNIKWYILSDGDNTTEVDVKRQITESFGSNYFEALFTLDELDFELYVLKYGYSNEIIAEINQHETKADFLSEYIQNHNYQPKGKDVEGKDIPRNYTSDADGGRSRALLDALHSNKTKYAPLIAQAILKKKDGNGKTIFPPKIDELFKKIASDLKIDLP
ncbi:putative ATP-dependent endonuclease of the OLD family [Flavobacterium branchiophilum]|uniref:Predicted ATP-dependent endonuclease of the OLD family n=1 Tax=Flavobacterium branchiophilum (strain FL-15) TaxID=1034807 RepID=G2Z4W9_FLABF|nr:AAA family ATPase [Flavobacterium branchiophilum]CCB70681.1 Predicted ATP-dependent endonuclease of the OLD family [Flavobacterium branchiophilum FL-15]